MGLIQKTLDFELFFADTVGFVPVQFGLAG